MKTKKTKQANLENRKVLFFQIGLILTLSVVLAAFEWKSNIEMPKAFAYRPTDEVIEIDVPITTPEKEKPIVKPPSIIEKLLITDNTVDIKDEPIFDDTEADWDDIINIPTFTKEEEIVDDPIHTNVEIMPTFLGQDAKYFRNFIAENIKFPTKAIEHGISGTVYISFVVNKDGSLENIQITRGVDPSVDQAVIDVIKKSPKWEPGLQSGRYVRVRYSTAVRFQIDSY